MKYIILATALLKCLKSKHNNLNVASIDDNRLSTFLYPSASKSIVNLFCSLTFQLTRYRFIYPANCVSGNETV